ncbi:MAG: heparan-alpha-glucosaminide N-acetyltransferase [Candidatus Thermoplasmatota archaeon]
MKKEFRFWEIDFLRGIAVIMMITYHVLYDLNFFGVINLDLNSVPFLSFLYPIGTLFLLLVGISLHLSFSRVKDKLSQKQIFEKFFFRGLKILVLGFIISFVTWVYLKDGWIIFGVLHCIGLSIILSIPLLKKKFINLFLGAIFVLIGVLLGSISFNFPWLLWLGFIPRGLYTVDYFPILPWFGIVLIGIFIGKSIYPEYIRVFNIKSNPKNYLVNFICFLGQNSLFIYFVHQPVLVGLINLWILIF